MKLTPLDIKKQEFTRSFRGFDVEEVQAFLQMLSNQWEEVLAEQRRLEQRIGEVDSKLRHYERIEEALQEALETARESSRQTLDGARQKATQIIDDAERQAEEIRREAERQRHDQKRGVDDLVDRQNQIIARLRAFLSSELELLTHFDASNLEAKRAMSGNLDNSSNAPKLQNQKRPKESERSLSSVPSSTDKDRIQVPLHTEEPDTEKIEPVGSPLLIAPESNVDTQKDAGNATWTMREVISSESRNTAVRENVDRPRTGKNEAGNPIASSDEIERIRRILRDLD